MAGGLPRNVKNLAQMAHEMRVRIDNEILNITGIYEDMTFTTFLTCFVYFSYSLKYKKKN